MTRPQLAVCIGVAVLVFWSVGAYNRLVSLRNRIAQAFAAVDAQIQSRHATLLRWLQAAPEAAAVGAAGVAAGASMPAGAGVDRIDDTASPPPAETALAAAQQLLSACDALRSRPGAARRAIGLRLAEQTLAGARARFFASVAGGAVDTDPAAVDAAARFGALADDLAAADNTLRFACQQFNEATAAYNGALRQWPTRLVGWGFGFREAGTL